MTSKGHRAAALGPAIALAVLIAPESSLLAGAVFVGCMVGGMGPDLLEVPSGDYRMIEHRTLTHCLLLWIVALVAIAGHGVLYGFNPVTAAAAGFCVGGLSHLSGDILTPSGIPLWHPYRRWSANLVRAGGPGEILWVAVSWLIGAAAVLFHQMRAGTL